MRVDNDVLRVLDAAECDGNELRLTGGQLDRQMYVRVNKVLEAAGGKWNRKAKAHVFEDLAGDAIEQVILTGEVVSAKQEFGFFPTPASVVMRLLELAKIDTGMEVLEPSAGRGHIVGPLVGCGAIVDCVELLPANVDHLEEAAYARAITEGDFLGLRPNPTYDRVVMNPPFARQADIRHVSHALGFLKPDGLLVSVMSNGVRFRENRLTVEFRDMAAARGGWLEDLPEKAFRESGTDVCSCIVVIPGGAA